MVGWRLMSTSVESVGVADSDDQTFQPPDTTALGSGIRRWGPPTICCGLYALVTIVLFGHLNSFGSAYITGPQTVDQIAEVWWLEWAEYAIWHGHNLFFTNWQNYPVGLNAEVAAAPFGLGVVISPLTKLFGPVVAWNVMVRVAVFASAVSMCLVLRRWIRWWPAAFAGGLLYGFSSYEMVYAGQQVDLSFAALPPLFFLIVYEIVFRQRWRASRSGVALGVVGSLQFLVSTEILVSSVLMAILGCALYVIPNRDTIATKWLYIKKALTSGLVTAAVLVAYPLTFMLFGPEHIDGPPNSQASLATYHGDLLGLFVPGYLQRLGTSHLTSFWLQHLGNSAMIYIGIPFFIAVIVTLLILWRHGIVLIAGVLAACSLILSLGSVLYVAGHDTHVPLPFIVLAYLPGTDGLLSTRLSLYTAMFGSAILAMGIEALYRRLTDRSRLRKLPSTWRRILGYSLAGIIVLIVGLPLVPAHAEQLSASGEPSSTVSQALKKIPHGSVVLAYPYPDSPVIPVPFTYKYESIDDALLDQAMTGLNFKLIGGYGWRPYVPAGYESSGTPSASELKPHSIQALFASSFYGYSTPPQQSALSHTDLTSDLRNFMHNYHVETVVVLPVGQNPENVVVHINAAIGAPSFSSGAAIWYGVQRRLALVSP
jgi:hypothetical protein